MTNICRFFASILTFFLLSLSVTTQAKETIRFAITDLEGIEQLQREFGAFKDNLSKYSGLEIKFYPGTQSHQMRRYF